MKPLAFLLLFAWACVTPQVSQSDASVLLDSFDFHNGGGTSPCELTPVEFYVGIRGSPPFDYAPVGRGLAAWGDGESGSFEITPGNEPLWDGLASLLTNGMDDPLFLISEMQGSNGAGGVGRPGSRFFPSGHDLVGNQLDFVRLDVSNVHIWTIDPTTQHQGWTTDVTYEFWGTPLPEPATALPILFTALMGCRRRRRRSL